MTVVRGGGKRRRQVRDDTRREKERWQRGNHAKLLSKSMVFVCTAMHNIDGDKRTEEAIVCTYELDAMSMLHGHEPKGH